MTTYRVVWLCICVPLGAVGAAVALVRSPEAATFLFAAFGVVGSLLTMCFAPTFGELRTGGRLMLLAVARSWREPASAPSSVTPRSWVRAFSCSPPRSWRARRTP